METNTSPATETKDEANVAVAPVESITPESDAIVSENKESEIAVEDYPHKRFVAEKNIDTKLLPSEIKYQISGWTLTIGRYTKNKLEKDLVSAKKQSILICHDIQNWIEKDLPGFNSEKEAAVEKAAVEKAAAEKAAAEKAAAEKEAEKEAAEKEELEKNKKEFTFVPPRQFKRPERRPEPKLIPPPKEIILTPEQKALNALDSDGRIHYKELEKIIDGKSLGFSLTLGSTHFVNEPMTNYYRVEK